MVGVWEHTTDGGSDAGTTAGNDLLRSVRCVRQQLASDDAVRTAQRHEHGQLLHEHNATVFVIRILPRKRYTNVSVDDDDHTRADNNHDNGAHHDECAHARAVSVAVSLRGQRHDWRPTRRRREHVFAAERVRQRYCGRRRARQSLLLGWRYHGRASEPGCVCWSIVLVCDDAVRLRLRPGELHHWNVDCVRADAVQLYVSAAATNYHGSADHDHDGAAARLHKCANTRANQRADACADAVLGRVFVVVDSRRSRFLHAAVLAIDADQRRGQR
jgi:hypothetical protein